MISLQEIVVHHEGEEEEHTFFMDIRTELILLEVNCPDSLLHWILLAGTGLHSPRHSREHLDRAGAVGAPLWGMIKRDVDLERLFEELAIRAQT